MSAYFLLLPILLPVAGGIVFYFCEFKRAPRLYISVVITVTALLAWAAVIFTDGETAYLFKFTDDLSLSLRLDGLGKLFIGLIATLFPVTTAYAFEYLRHEEHLHSFYCFFMVSFGVTLGIASASNLITMYCFYEMLTLATLPLVAHTMTHSAVRAGRSYLAFSIGGAAFAFIGVVFLAVNGAGGGFSLGGNLISLDDKDITLAVYVLSFIGFGVKAALFPVHAWLPKASVAPTPVTALLHAVAVVKAGAFAIIRLTFYSFGTDILRGTWAQNVVMALAVFTIFYGSSKAFKEGHWKRRLAYSTVANLSYILFGVTVMTQEGLSAALLHMLFHAVIKILAFFCAGAVLHQTKREYLFELDGLGKKMPVTFACFTVSALALTGIPPFNGFVSKWSLLTAAAASENTTAFIGAAVLLVSALLTALYMFSAAVRAFFPKKGTDLNTLAGIKEAHPLMTVPMLLLTAAIVLSGVFAAPIADLTANIAAGIF